MLDYKALARLPESITLQRNGVELNARRQDIGCITVSRKVLWIADAQAIDELPPLAISVPNGSHSVFVYEWRHRGESINACALIRFRQPRSTLTRQILIDTPWRPDLRRGVITDSAEIAFRADDEIRMQSGLGDGYYPVFGNWNFSVWLQSVIVDFQLWNVEKVALFPGQQFDEFGLVVPDEPGA